MRKIQLMTSAFVGSVLMACAHAGTEREIEPAVETLHSYILLDRTGSMSSIWDEALTSVNAYADAVAEDDDGESLDANVTLAVFDAQEGLQFNVLRDEVPADRWRPVTEDEAAPRGMTPLFDAIGRIIDMAEDDRPEKAVIVIMTDGEENASRELTRAGAAAALDRAEARGWEVVFLGAEFANFDDAEAVGMSREKTMAVSKDAMAETMRNVAKKSRAYGNAVSSAPVEFDAEDRALAEEEDVKQRKGN